MLFRSQNIETVDLKLLAWEVTQPQAMMLFSVLLIGVSAGYGAVRLRERINYFLSQVHPPEDVSLTRGRCTIEPLGSGLPTAYQQIFRRRCPGFGLEAIAAVRVLTIEDRRVNRVRIERHSQLCISSQVDQADGTSSMDTSYSNSSSVSSIKASFALLAG